MDHFHPLECLVLGRKTRDDFGSPINAPSLLRVMGVRELGNRFRKIRNIDRRTNAIRVRTIRAVQRIETYDFNHKSIELEFN